MAPAGQGEPAGRRPGDPVVRFLRRVLPSLGGVAAGVALAVTGLWGSRASVDDASDALALDDYCAVRFGERSRSYRPRELDRWGCSAWTNGVWRLEPVDLNDACHWQRGPGARLGAVDTSEREVACTG